MHCISISRFPIQCGLRLSGTLYHQATTSSAISRFPIQCGLRQHFYHDEPIVDFPAISRFPIQCGLRLQSKDPYNFPPILSVAFQFSADYDSLYGGTYLSFWVYQSLSNSVRITTFYVRNRVELIGNFYQSLSNSVRITTSFKGKYVKVEDNHYQSLSNSVRITTLNSFFLRVFLYFPISRFPIQCGLRHK